jgi:hypothetical protein
MISLTHLPKHPRTQGWYENFGLDPEPTQYLHRPGTIVVDHHPLEDYSRCSAGVACVDSDWEMLPAEGIQVASEARRRHHHRSNQKLVVLFQPLPPSCWGPYPGSCELSLLLPRPAGMFGFTPGGYTICSATGTGRVRHSFEGLSWDCGSVGDLWYAWYSPDASGCVGKSGCICSR